MRVAIHQPNFLPWTGYFNKIKSVDTFVFFDDVQFERGKTYTSRTKILVNGMESWLTIPVQHKSDLVLIKDMCVDTTFPWKNKHLKTLELNYKKSSFFQDVFAIIEKVYNQDSPFLIDYNIPLITMISDYMGLKTAFLFSSQLSDPSMTGLEKIIYLLQTTSASTYLSGNGSGSKRYINENEFQKTGISVEWQTYQQVHYPQLNTTEFIPNLSIIDMLFNCGKDAAVHL